MIHVNPSFKILSADLRFATSQLFVEAGPTGVSIAVLDNSNCFRAAIVYPFPAGLHEGELAENLSSIFTEEKLLQQHFGKTHIFWSFAESILVPAELMNADRNSNMLNLVFGDAKNGIVRSDFLFKHNLHNVYRIPSAVTDIFSTHLPVATQTHVFSALVNKNIPEGNNLFTVFYSNSITIVLGKEGRLQVVQRFDYSSPDDCVFHLLNVCKGFDVATDSVNLHISGMIDVKSGLYEAIHKYFLHIEFDELPGGFDYDNGIKEYPQHFFSHLFSLATCV